MLRRARLPGAALVPAASIPAPEVATLTIQGPAAGGTGTAVAQLGDVNGDGRPDAAVAAPFADFLARPDAGIVAVVFGSPDTRGAGGFESVPGFRIVGGRYYRAGYGLAAAGDVNGDGATTSWCPRRGTGSPGTRPRVECMWCSARRSAHRSTSARSASRGFEIVGAEPWGSAAPDSLAGAGDLDADGFDDVVVSEAVYSRGGRRHRRRRDRHLRLAPARPGRPPPVGSRGFRLTGVRRTALAPAGDVNGRPPP